jgi:hypothetical protein
LKLGLFEDPIPPLDDPLLATVGQESDWDLSLNIARGAITLLKNQGDFLPLPFTEAPISATTEAPTPGIDCKTRLVVESILLIKIYFMLNRVEGITFEIMNTYYFTCKSRACRTNPTIQAHKHP